MRPLRRRDFRNLWLGQTVSTICAEIAVVAVRAAGGVIIATAGVPWTFGIDAATYAASLLVIWWLPKLPPLEDVDRPSFRSIVDGFRFLRSRQALIGIFAIDTNAMVF